MKHLGSNGASLYNASVRSKVSSEDCYSACFAVRIINSSDNGCIKVFRRGDIFRGQVMIRSGVTYGAYGKGIKPRIYGSPYDAAKVGKWVETTTPNVYMFSEDLPDDVGTLVFNSGEQVDLVVKIKGSIYNTKAWITDVSISGQVAQNATYSASFKFSKLEPNTSRL